VVAVACGWLKAGMVARASTLVRRVWMRGFMEVEIIATEPR
jgi:hypothetical protein